MKALEFDSSVSSDQSLPVPPEIARQLPAGSPVRVILLIPEDSEDTQWSRLAESEFFAGYAPEDGVYDHL